MNSEAIPKTELESIPPLKKIPKGLSEISWCFIESLSKNFICDLKMKKAFIAGGGGFIGGYLIDNLLQQGYNVVAVDIKPFEQWYQFFDTVENHSVNLENKDNCVQLSKGCDVIYNLACNMGGMGFIENNKALCMLSVLINTHLLMAAKEHGIQNFFYSSSACVYQEEKQVSPDVTPLRTIPLSTQP